MGGSPSISALLVLLSLVLILRETSASVAAFAPSQRTTGKVSLRRETHLGLLVPVRSRCTGALRINMHQEGSDERDATLDGVGSSHTSDDDDDARTLPPRPPPPERTPTANEVMMALGTTPRRIFLSLAGSSVIALGANFLGVTSNLLSTLPPDAVESSGLDTYYPVDGFKRFNGREYGYTLVIPKEWVADTAVELAKATRMAGTLDYGMRRGGSGAVGAGVLPDAAFGPPMKKDSRGLTPQGADTNISVVISKLRPGFTLRGSLGPPREAAETLLRVSLAPEGSGRVGTLLTAFEVRRGASDVYQLEYDVDRGERGVPLRAISVIGVRGNDTLLTSTVVAPKADWSDSGDEAKLRRMAESFRLTQ